MIQDLILYGTKRDFFVLVIRVLLGVGGVTGAIFFQAWSLPVFLSVALLLGWVIEFRREHRQDRKSGIYITNLMALFVCLIFAIILADSSKKLLTQFLLYWDGISVRRLTISEHVLPDNGLFTRQSIKLAMNLTALIVPILAAISYHELISAFSRKTNARRRIIYAGLFVFFAFFPLWAMTETSLSTWRANLIIFSFFFFQSSVLFFLFRQL